MQIETSFGETGRTYELMFHAHTARRAACVDRSAPSSCSRVRSVVVFVRRVEALVAAVTAGAGAIPLLDREIEAPAHISRKESQTSTHNEA